MVHHFNPYNYIKVSKKSDHFKFDKKIWLMFEFVKISALS